MSIFRTFMARETTLISRLVKTSTFWFCTTILTYVKIIGSLGLRKMTALNGILV